MQFLQFVYLVYYLMLFLIIYVHAFNMFSLDLLDKLMYLSECSFDTESSKEKGHGVGNSGKATILCRSFPTYKLHTEYLVLFILIFFSN